jgi:hypothetical protein
MGRYEAAIPRINETIATTRGGVTPEVWAYLAMCHYHLGHTAEAERLIEKARQAGQVFKPGSWVGRLEYQLPLREAEALIHGPR